MSFSDVDLSESPVIGNFSPVHGPSSLETTGNNGCVVINADTNFRGLITEELHSAGTRKTERASFFSRIPVINLDLAELVGSETNGAPAVVPYKFLLNGS